MRALSLLLVGGFFLAVLSGCGTPNTSEISSDSIQTKTSQENSAMKTQEEKDSSRSQDTKTNSSSKKIVNKQPLMKEPIVTLHTNQGDIKLKLYINESPKTVQNFIKLAEEGFYDETKFHRVMEDFMIQGGDPNSKDDDWSNDGMGGPGYTFADEFNNHKLVRGSLAMANSGANTNGSQFFIVTTAETPWLDEKHTNFGEVIEGMDVVDTIEKTPVNANNHPLEDMTINSITITQ